MSPKKIHWRERKRTYAMLWAYLIFHARKQPQASREIVCWALLLEWAELGGKPGDPVPGG